MTSGSGTGYRLYALVDEEQRELAVQPRLASWDAITSPTQRRLQDYLDHLEDVVGSGRETAGPEALDLRVGLPEDAPVRERGHDLDNYLYPVAKRFDSRNLRLVRGSKQQRHASALAWGTASPSAAIVDLSWSFVEASSSKSATTSAWKEEIRGQISEQHRAPEDGQRVAMEVAFRVDPSRNWVNLWKPTIDCLGPILGAGERRFAPRDDLITRLGLHQTTDQELGYRVEVGVWWRPMTSQPSDVDETNRDGDGTQGASERSPDPPKR